MHAWAALKPADIVMAARALRDMVTRKNAVDAAPDAASADAPAEEKMLTGDSAAAE